jgi:RNA polymerase sigma-70 factor (ECF subfamily)
MQPADPEHIQSIVRRASAGDPDAFAELYTAYFTPLYRYIYFRVSDKADADDLTQEVFLKAYASFSSYVSKTESPLSYFYTIARNQIIDHYRKKKAVSIPEEVLQAITDARDSVEEEFARKEEQTNSQKKLTHLISTLPTDQQDAIVFRYINGLPNKEISVIVGKSEMALRQLQSRGLRALRKLA